MAAKILVVDDSATDRLIIKDMLSEYHILTAHDGVEAMRAIDVNPDIDLIILDLNMPHMDGFQVLKKLKSDKRYEKLRTIILTNYDEIENEVKGLQLGAVDYIRKPIHMESLKVRIEIHFQLLSMQRFVEQELHEQGLTFNAVFYQAPIGIAISCSERSLTAGDVSFLLVNPMYEKITGRTSAELMNLGWEQITHPDDVEEEQAHFEKLRAGDIKSYALEKRYLKPDGSIVWAYIVVAPIASSQDQPLKYIRLVQDITERKETEKALAESERSKSAFLSHLPGVAYICSYDYAGTMRYISEGCHELTGYAPESFLDNKDLAFNDIITSKCRKLLWAERAKAASLKAPYRCEYELITAGGEHKWVLELGQGTYNEQGDVETLEGIIIDISDKKEMENDLIYKNQHDIWTGLLNRRYLENILAKDATAPLTGKRAVVSINLSTIHLLSLTYGFHYSQALLKKVADSLRTYCDDSHQLFSTYEYRFVFYVKGYQDKNDLNAFCKAVAVTLEATLDVERVGGGIGVLEIDEANKQNIEQLLKNLLVTSETAINTYKNDIGICFFDAQMEVQIIREETISRELSQIVAGENPERLFLQYQPILDLRTNQISGFEALARLDSDHLGLVSPLKFIPIAEKTKLIVPLGDMIMQKALHFLKTVEERGYHVISISVNISAIQLLREGFMEHLIEVIHTLQLTPESVCLEFTESVFFPDFKNINSILGEIKKYGIKVALDDFGTGYSSFAREQELNVDCLKIDKFFIDGLMVRDPEESIAGNIISMAHKIGHIVVAEGVEYERQLQYLKAHDCDRIQGYLIGKPLAEAEALALLEKSQL